MATPSSTGHPFSTPLKVHHNSIAPTSHFKTIHRPNSLCQTQTPIPTISIQIAQSQRASWITVAKRSSTQVTDAKSAQVQTVAIEFIAK